MVRKLQNPGLALGPSHRTAKFLSSGTMLIHALGLVHFLYQCLAQALSGICFWTAHLPSGRYLIQNSLILTICLDYYILYFTLSARLDPSQHLSLGLFSCLHSHAWSFWSFTSSYLLLPATVCYVKLRLHAAIWQWLIENPVCIFISHVGGKPYSWPQQGKKCSHAGCAFDLRFLFFFHIFYMSNSMDCTLYQREEILSGTIQTGRESKLWRNAQHRQNYELDNFSLTLSNFSWRYLFCFNASFHLYF